MGGDAAQVVGAHHLPARVPLSLGPPKADLLHILQLVPRMARISAQRRWNATMVQVQVLRLHAAVG